MKDRETVPLRVGIVGCGLIGRKRAVSLGGDTLVACHDVAGDRAEVLAGEAGGEAVGSLDAVLDREVDVVVVAVTHDQLAELACAALQGGAHVLVEKPGGIGVSDVDTVADAAARADRLVKVGFNHRFYPGIRRAIGEAKSGRFGPVMFFRARYGHGGRLGYEAEWRAQFEISGGGEIVDQGMHLLDLGHWLAGPLPLHGSLLRTNFWDTEVEDNAVLVLGEDGDRAAPWGTFHVSWTEWKNLFSLEIYCRTGKLRVEGLAKSYGPQTLTIYAMKPELGPPEIEELTFPAEDTSWRDEWAHFRDVIQGEEEALLGSLDSARYAWSCVEEAYARSCYHSPEVLR